MLPVPLAAQGGNDFVLDVPFSTSGPGSPLAPTDHRTGREAEGGSVDHQPTADIAGKPARIDALPLNPPSAFGDRGKSPIAQLLELDGSIPGLESSASRDSLLSRSSSVVAPEKAERLTQWEQIMEVPSEDTLHRSEADDTGVRVPTRRPTQQASQRDG